MTWKARLIEPEELAATIDLTALAFAVGPRATENYRKQAALVTEPDRVFVVDDGEVLAGTGASFSMALALPGGETLPLAGVTEVGVSPAYRRRGILRTLMEAVHDQALDRGEPIAGLTASEGGIYRRFGYGVATRFQSLSIDRPSAAEVEPLTDDGSEPTVDDRDASRIRVMSDAEAGPVLPAVWERYWRRVPGEVRRPAAWWEMLALDVEEDRDGASARFVAVHEDAAGVPDGFVTYRVKQGWGSGRPLPHEVRVESVAAVDDGVATALLRFVRGVDLVGTVEWAAAPLDLPFRWRLANPRALQVTREVDHLWLRPFDVSACLARRRYAVEGACVLEVIDPVRPALGGRFRLDGGPDGATCRRSDAEPDVVVGVADLGALLLGGVSWSTLHRAGLIDERTSGAVTRADGMFRPDRAPYCSTDF
ncbi:MAG TPA: GNAT family N-acetyltransferase [Acidimicrobiales bacterium]|nr:GNAT family N-acetyltransferase [Acidimicrobiales bacterium]